MNMKIGLIDTDTHASKKKWGATIYPNLALCKIAAWHKGIGDEVEWYNPLNGHYDKVYIAKIFNFTSSYDYVIDADEIIRGGTGYDVQSKLEGYIDACQPDYSIYPNVPTDTSYGFLTRGCPNKCSWCVVPKKEGEIKPYWDIEDVANGRPKVVLMDNNILAAGDYAHEQIDKIIHLGLKVDFNQALDARLMTDEFAKKLAKVKWIDRRIRFGCDTHMQIQDCEKAISLLNSYGYKGEYFLYTMIGVTDIKECYDRLMYWWEKNHKVRLVHHGNGVYPYAQPYRNPYNRGGVIPEWQKDMARWCNKRMVFETIRFEDFEPRIGFKCSEYFN